ncbi:hypothetical protein EYF80_054169 [Liparis tanakae]|uniref:Uncharacterized protein n=1 Tax=Liparis tanakae TaxID=230148 RepID=A0A4Z2F3E7_9TELE|nr:hypothetical protein EYF80_054169 [Liparis tanakae]
MSSTKSRTINPPHGASSGRLPSSGVFLGSRRLIGRGAVTTRPRVFRVDRPRPTLLRQGHGAPGSRLQTREPAAGGMWEATMKTR